MKLQSVFSGVFFSGFKDDLQRAKNVLSQNQQLDSFTKSGGTVIIEKVEITESGAKESKLKKVGEGVATTAVGGAAGGAMVHGANVYGENVNSQLDDVDTTSTVQETLSDTINDTADTVSDTASDASEAIQEKIASTDMDDIDEKLDVAKSIFDFIKDFTKSILDLD